MQSGRLTVAQFLECWLAESVKPKVRPRTFQSYDELVRVHLAPGLGRTRLNDLTPRDVQRFINRKLNAGLSPRRVKEQLLQEIQALTSMGRTVGQHQAFFMPTPLPETPETEEDEIDG